MASWSLATPEEPISSLSPRGTPGTVKVTSTVPGGAAGLAGLAWRATLSARFVRFEEKQDLPGGGPKHPRRTCPTAQRFPETYARSRSVSLVGGYRPSRGGPHRVLKLLPDRCAPPGGPLQLVNDVNER